MEANSDELTAVAADGCILMTQQEQVTAEQRPRRNVKRPVRYWTQQGRNISTMGNSCDKECEDICKAEIDKRCINKIASAESQQNIGLLAIGVEDSSNAACNCGSTALMVLEILVIIQLVACCGYYTYNVVNQLLEKRNKKWSEHKKLKQELPR